MDFHSLYKEFENTHDVSNFYDKYDDDLSSTRFLLIRSLDNTNLDDLYVKISGKHFEPRTQFEFKCASIYDSDISNNEIIKYIENKRAELIANRAAENEGLDLLVREFGSVSCGLRNDKVDDIIKEFVRDKTIKEYPDFQNRLENDVLIKIKSYIEWSFYNQITNDLIEMYLLNNSKIIPTLRKIHDIDFFLKIDNKIIPFDLKITHVSDSFFNIYSQGLTAINGDDSFSIDEGIDNELVLIKKFYKSIKREFNLPPYSQMHKVELIKELEKINDPRVFSFLNNAYDNRKFYVRGIRNNLKALEWWNYKDQGERLFCNNNRFFIFMAYEDSFEDGRPLKGCLEDVGNNITNLLGNISLASMHRIKYVYEKQSDLNGRYETLCFSTYIIGRKNGAQ